MTRVAEFAVDFIQFLDASGKPTQELPAHLAGANAIAPMYRLMALTRALDAKAIALQRTGQLGTYASSLGQEAIGAAAGLAMREEDVLVPSYREQAAQFARGVKLEELLLYWSGDERGSRFSGPQHDFPICIPIATQSCHAVGAAVAFKLRGEPRVAVEGCGDGATSKGDFYESLNLAGAWRLPVVFVVSNNQWAISVPRSRQSGAQTLAQKAIAGGIKGVQVDGNDPVAMRFVMDMALERARSDGGPTLIEAITYRLHDHTTADDASRYRDAKEVEAAKKADPMIRTRRYLESIQGWSERDQEALDQECARQVQAAVEAYLATPPEPPQAMFDSLYAELPRALARQRDEAIKEWSDG